MPTLLRSFALVVLTLLPQTLAAATTAITNVTAIDAVNGQREAVTVLFAGDEILAVQTAAEPVQAEEVIDGRGQFLIPGLWDFHVHMTFDPRLTDNMIPQFLSYGITSVRDTGGLLHEIQPVVDKMRAEGAVAPRIFYAGPLLDGDYVVYDGKARPEIGIRNATVEQGEANVRRLKASGVDFIKVYEMVSPEVLQALVETARELDLPVDSHVPLSMRASGAGQYLDSLEHLRNVELDCAGNAEELHQMRLEALKNPEQVSGYALRSSLHQSQRPLAMENYSEEACDKALDALMNTVQVPTLRLNSYALHPAHQRDDFAAALATLPESVAASWTDEAREMDEAIKHPLYIKSGQWSLDLIGKMHGKGLPIAAGTDTPITLSVPGYSLHTEMELLVAAGLSPMEALHAATIEPAKFFGLEKEMGAIAPGQKADLVLLRGNPLEAISNVRQVVKVVSKGEVYSPEALR